jgi:hypothetical protein
MLSYGKSPSNLGIAVSDSSVVVIIEYTMAGRWCAESWPGEMQTPVER